MPTQKKIAASVIMLSIMISTVASGEESSTFGNYNIKFSPRVDLITTSSDNIKNTQKAVSDTKMKAVISGDLLLTKPQQEIRSSFSANTTKNFQVKSEEVTDYSLGTRINQTFSSSFKMSALINYNDSTLSRKALSEEDVDSRTDIKTIAGSLGASYTTGKQSYTLSLKHTRFDLVDAMRRGKIVNKDDEDRKETILNLHGSYMLNKVFQPSFSIGIEDISYSQGRDDFGLSRSSSVYQALIGAKLALSPFLTISGEGGYYHRDFRGGDFKAVKAFIRHAQVKIKARKDLAISLTHGYSFREINLAFTPGMFVDTLAGNVNYNATESLSFSAGVTKVASVMDVIFVKANDYISSIGATYIYDKHYSAHLSLSNSRRFTNSPGSIQVFTENSAILKLSARF